MYRKERNNGFTLIELLIVVAIIALLVSISLPSLQKARSTAQRVVCGTTVNQIFKANGMYADENKNHYVPVFIRDKPENIWIKNQKYRRILSLPEKTTGKAWGGMYCPELPDEIVKSSNTQHNYGWNVSHLIGRPGNSEDLRRVNRSKITRPSMRLAIIDSSDYWVVPDHAKKDLFWDIHGEYNKTEAGTGAGLITAYRHNETANVSFYDGHVENRDYKSIYHDGNDSSRRRLWDAMLRNN